MEHEVKEDETIAIFESYPYARYWICDKCGKVIYWQKEKCPGCGRKVIYE